MTERQARREAADAMRALTPLIAWGLVPETTLRATAEALNELAETLRPYARSSRYEGTNGIRLDAEDGGAGNASLWEGHCVIGASNPHAPPVELDTTAEVVVGRVQWGAAYEGQKGYVHGGALASALDVVLGHAAAKAGRPAVTGTMTLRFLRPVPIDADVTLEASLVDVDGRKVRVHAAMVVDGETAVVGDATFITVAAERFGAPAQQH